MEEKSEGLGFLNIIILILSIYVLIAILIDTFFPVPQNIHELLQIIDDGICFIFIYEFFHRLIIAKRKIDYLKWGWIDLISSIPAFPFVRIGRLFRLVRLLRILRAFRSVRVLLNHLFENKAKGTITLVSICTLLIVIFSSISILIVEKNPQSNIQSAEDAIWWSIVTVTTVGYGDKFPVTTEGRIIGTILMLFGVGMFGTYTAYIAAWFSSSFKNNKEN
jgi:voltage-gated potassium channel